MSDELIHNDYARFGDYVRELSLAALDTAGQTQRLVNLSDLEFITALNEYLLSEGCQPIDVSERDMIADGAAQTIAHGLDIGHLNQTDNVFNRGVDHADRVRSRSRNQALANLSFALDRYLTACEVPVQIGRHLAVPRDELTAAAMQPQLWRRRIDRDASGSMHSTLEQVRSIDWNKKPVVCFGGIGAMALNPQELNGLMKQAETLLGGMKIVNRDGNEGVELYCVSYPAEHRVKLNGYVNAFNADYDQYVVPFMQEVYQTFFRPSIAAMLDEPGEVKPHQLKPLLRQWNFFTTSFGSVCVKSLSSLLAEDLQQHGMSHAQIRALLAEVFTLNANPVNRLDDVRPYGNFSAIHLVSRNDVTVRSRANHQRIIADDVGELVIPISDNELLVWSDHPRRGLMLSELSDDEITPHSSANIKMSEQLSGRAANENTGHHMQITTGHVMRRDEEAAATYFAPDIPANALRHAVINEGRLGQVKDLLTPIRLANYPRPFATPAEHGNKPRESGSNDNAPQR